MAKMFLSTNKHNFEIIILDAATKKENLNWISKFRLPANVAQHINLYLIFYDVYIDDPTIVLDIELNLWVFNCLESYQFSLSLIFNLILKVFCDKFYGWKYTEFSKLDQNIRQVFKKTFMAKKIYMDRLSGYIN